MYKARSYQAEAISAIFHYFKSGKKGNPLVVAPTGSGKSIIIAEFCRIVLDKWPDQKILVVSHVKEILRQNYEKMKTQIPNKKIGIFSSGLKSKTVGSVTIAGIQSIYNKPELFDSFNLIIVDEAHTIPFTKGGRYHTFFEQVTRPVVGFTATPFRLGRGYLHLGQGAFFDDIVYTITISRLQAEGHLCALSTKGTEETMDADGIKKQSGDFILKELSLAFDRSTMTKKIVKELTKYKDARKKWLVFAIDIAHCEHITEELNNQGISAAAVHSKMSNRDAIIEQYFEKYQALVSVAVLTTGFDAPFVDLIALMRPTASPTLHIQIIGRGLRPNPGKTDCLVLDFAGNLKRNGPIDSPIIRLKGEGGGEAVVKQCPMCAEIVHAAVRVCPCCNHKFLFKHNLTEKPDDGKGQEVPDEWFEVNDVKYYNYTGSKNIPMLKVTYQCGVRSFSEYVCIEHPGFASHKAKRWWERRAGYECPESVFEAIKYTDDLKLPVKILVNEGGKFDTIKDHFFG